MSPNTSYDQTEDGIIVAGYEYGAEIFEDYFENDIPPHARAFLWECIDVSELLAALTRVRNMVHLFCATRHRTQLNHIMN